jgi:glycosyltransferase involved in cell wall biosynthesis
MKVLYVVQNYFPSIGGTQILFQNVAEKSKEYYGDDSIVYTSNSLYGPDKKEFKEIDQAIETINGVTVHRFPFIRFHYWLSSKIIMILKLAKINVPQRIQRYRSGPWSPALAKAMNTTDAEVICASSSSYLYMLYPLYRHTLKNPKPFVFQGAIHFSEDINYQVLFKKTIEAIKASDCYLANTAYEKERLVQMGVDPNKIVVTGIGVDMEVYANGNRQYYRTEFGLSDDDVLVGYIGRIEVTKGINILIDAIRLVQQKNSKLHLVIGGFKSDYANQLEILIKEVGNDQLKVHFAYNLSVEQKVDLYHALDVFVLPSVNESFGMVFLEAWSCKKPVIGTNMGAIRSVISEGVDGFLMKPNDPEHLAGIVLALCNNKGMREELGTNGFKKTAENYTWPVIIKKYRDVFTMAINKFYVHGRS